MPFRIQKANLNFTQKNKNRKHALRVLLVNPICACDIKGFIEEAKKRKFNADEPLGLAYLSAYIKKILPEVDIEIYDHHIDSLRVLYEDKNAGDSQIAGLFKSKIANFQPDIVGISGPYYLNSGVVHVMASIVKEMNPDICVIMGGIYPTASPEMALSDRNIDFLLLAEAEFSLRDFLEYKLERKSFSQLQSIAFRKDSGEIEVRLHRTFIKDLDELGFPDRSNLPIGKYSIWGRTAVDRFYKKDSVVASLQATRGCPYLCTFCSGHVITQRYFRKRNIKNVIAEIKLLRDQFGVDVFIFNDENANVDTKWCLDLYDEMIKEKLGIKWLHGGGFYVHLMNDALIAKAIESGLLMFNLAIESGSRKVMKMVKKTDKIIDLAPQVIQKIRNCDPNIYITGFFLVGFPFESREDLQQTVQLAAGLDLDWAFFNIFQPFPGSELYDYCIKNGHLNPLDNFRENLTHYLFTPLKNTLLSPSEIEETMYLANLSINFVYSRSLKTANFERALRDYGHVASIARDHALAHFCLSKAYSGLGQVLEAGQELSLVNDILISNPVQRKYFDFFGLSIEECGSRM